MDIHISQYHKTYKSYNTRKKRYKLKNHKITYLYIHISKKLRNCFKILP